MDERARPAFDTKPTYRWAQVPTLREVAVHVDVQRLFVSAGLDADAVVAEHEYPAINAAAESNRSDSIMR